MTIASFIFKRVLFFLTWAKIKKQKLNLPKLDG